jgi:hypothetical protein
MSRSMVRAIAGVSLVALLAIPGTAWTDESKPRAPQRKLAKSKVPWISPVYWIAVDYLSWSFKRGVVPVSQTPSYPVLPFGADPEQNPKSGARVTLGVALDRFNLPGASAETSVFLLARSNSFANPIAGVNTTVSPGYLQSFGTVINVPATTTQTGVGSGGVVGTFRTVLAGFEENLVQKFGGPARFYGSDIEFSWLGGIRYLHLSDRVSLGGVINQTGSAVTPSFDINGAFTSSETFSNEMGAWNDFSISGHLPIHSITRSARASTVSGIVTPSAFAVCRLIDNSTCVGCSTGRSAGFAPANIFFT